MSRSSKHFIRVLFVFLFLNFGSIFLSMWLLNQLIPNAGTMQYGATAGMSMLFVSFLWSMIAWQGLEIIYVFLGILGKILTLGMSQMDAPEAYEFPPHIWKLVTHSAFVCGVYGLVLAFANEAIPYVVVVDFTLVGACWGSLLIFFARLGWLPMVEYQILP